MCTLQELVTTCKQQTCHTSTAALIFNHIGSFTTQYYCRCRPQQHIYFYSFSFNSIYSCFSLLCYRVSSLCRRSKFKFSTGEQVLHWSHILGTLNQMDSQSVLLN